MTIVRLQDVTKNYGAVQALRGLSLEVQAGEVIGFLGPNGAGKSTAIAIMLGLRQPTSGAVELFGLAPTSPAARARTGVMLQELGVPGSLRVVELVGLFQSYYPFTLPTAEILARANLTAQRRALVATLSGGQKQRLYFALALAGDPDLLFLDEPTAALDVELRRAFWEQVRGFAALGKTILFSTHYLEEADALAHRIVVINHGQVVAEGSPQAIKQLAADKTVWLRTDLDAATARGYATVQAAEVVGDELRVTTTEPAAFLRQVFHADWEVSDVRITDVDLEHAFIHLTHEERT